MIRTITASVMALALALPVFTAESASQSVRVRSSSHTSITSDGKTTRTETESREESTSDDDTDTRHFRHVFSCVGTNGADREECMEQVEWNDDGKTGSASRRLDVSDDDDDAGFASADAWDNLPDNVRAFIRNHLSARLRTSVLSEDDEDNDTSRMSMKERSQMRREMRRVSWEICSQSFAGGGRSCLRGSVGESN